MKPATRWWLLGGGVVAIAVLFVLLRPEDEEATAPSLSSPTIGVTTVAPTATGPSQTPSAPGPTTPPDAVEIEVEVEDGRVKGPGEVEVTQGERVRLVVESDVADEVHVHGYDLLADVTPSRAAVIVFRADAPGVYEVELEGAGLVLLQLSVVP